MSHTHLRLLVGREGQMIQETARFLILAAIFSMALVGTAFLAGCESTKYYECVLRDNTRNPCN
jgi:hypothetical protein